MQKYKEAAHGTNVWVCEEDCDCLPHHMKVKEYDITFLETKGLENIGDAANFTSM